jgi:hypothetical protein
MTKMRWKWLLSPSQSSTIFFINSWTHKKSVKIWFVSQQHKKCNWNETHQVHQESWVESVKVRIWETNVWHNQVLSFIPLFIYIWGGSSGGRSGGGRGGSAEGVPGHVDGWRCSGGYRSWSCSSNHCVYMCCNTPLSTCTSYRMNTIIEKFSRKNLKIYITNDCAQTSETF